MNKAPSSSCPGKSRKRIARAASHGSGAGGQGFFDQRLNLSAETRLGPRKQSKAFYCGASDDIGRIVVERYQQAGGAQTMASRLRNTSDDQTQMRPGSPVLTCFLWADLAEKTEQAFGVRRQEVGLPFGDAASSVGGVMAQDRIASEECTQERFEQLGAGEDLVGGPARVRESPGSAIELQRVVAGGNVAGHRGSLGRSIMAQLTISS